MFAGHGMTHTLRYCPRHPERRAYCRGLCKSCYELGLRLKRRRKLTDAEMVTQGYFLPAQHARMQKRRAHSTR